MPAAVRGGSATGETSGQGPQPAKARPQAPPRRAGASCAPLGGWACRRTHVLMAAAARAAVGAGRRRWPPATAAERMADAVASARRQRSFAGMGFKAQGGPRAGRLARGHAPTSCSAAGVCKDQPLIGLDLDAVRQRVEAVGWVKEARVVRLLPDTLVIAVKERDQLAVWQHGGRSLVIDDQGQVIPEADAGRFPSLPLVVGEGAEQSTPPRSCRCWPQRPRLMARIEALVRVDDRRWDLRLKDGA